MLDLVDPVPVDLVERMQFALALDEVYDEVAQMSRVLEDALAVRTQLDAMPPAPRRSPSPRSGSRRW